MAQFLILERESLRPLTFVDGQPSGCQRMKFGPDDQLYMASLSTGLTRMKFDGQTPAALQAVRIRPRGEGFVMQLTQPLAADANLAPEQFKIRRDHYLYTGREYLLKAFNDVTLP